MKIASKVLSCYILVLFLPCISRAGDKCPRVSVSFRAASKPWKPHLIGEDRFADRPWGGASVERYFQDEDIRGKIAVCGGCMDRPTYLDDLVSSLDCLSLGIYRISKGEFPRFGPRLFLRNKEPFVHAAFEGLRINFDDREYKSSKNKRVFYDHEGHSDCLVTEEFSIIDMIGRNLPEGSYIIVLLVSDSCGYRIGFYRSYRTVRIFKPTTRKLRAFWLCRQAKRMLRQSKDYRSILDEVISKKIRPAIEIDERCSCAYYVLAEYYNVKEDKEKFKKYWKLACDTTTFLSPEHEMRCMFRVNDVLRNWDDPRIREPFW